MRHFLFILLSATQLVSAQVNPVTWVFLSDKPHAFKQAPSLSQAALERRVKHSIALDARDYPIHQAYQETLESAGVTVVGKSRWLNAVAVLGSAEELKHLQKLPFVKGILPARSMQAASLNYGAGQATVGLVNGVDLHDQNYQGQGQVIAVIDGGFTGVDQFTAFDSLWMNNRILGTYDFVDGDTDVYHLGSHGMSVLSVMAANLPGTLVGCAPQASYLLLKSEDQSQEVPAEEVNWIMAAEWADSAGATVINSSLGYNTFDNPTFNHSLNELDGQTLPITRAADIAASKGILVVLSAGNEGGNSWNKITPPSDGDSVLCVGGVDFNGSHVGFSGVGPTADGRTKPDVVAGALAVPVVVFGGAVAGQNGTSFAAPLVAGMGACLWQAHPQKSMWEIYQAIKQSGNYSWGPNNQYGWGIPNFGLAHYNLESPESATTSFVLYPNPVTSGRFQLTGIQGNVHSLRVITLHGVEQDVTWEQEGEVIRVSLSQLSSGWYLVLLDNLAYPFLIAE